MPRYTNRQGEDEFNAMSVDEREQIIEYIFGTDEEQEAAKTRRELPGIISVEDGVRAGFESIHLNK